MLTKNKTNKVNKKMKDQIKISTKVDRNGNVYELAIDTDSREYRIGYFIFYASENDIDMKKREIDKLAKRLDFLGFKKVTL